MLKRLKSQSPGQSERIGGEVRKTFKMEREAERVLTSHKLPVTIKMTPLVDDVVSVEEALIRIVNRMGEPQEQISNRMSELEIAVHIEKEGLQ